MIITLIYLLVGGGWILFSDHFAGLIAGEIAQLAAVQTIKGLGYVLITGAGLFALISHQMRALQRSERHTLDETKARAELAAYLDAIIDAAPVAIIDLDEGLRIHRLWNRGAVELFGYTAQEALGNRPPILSSQACSSLESARSQVTRGERIPRLEIDLLRQDGTSFPAMVASAPVLTDTGTITVVIVSDITELKATVSRLTEAIDEREVLLREIHHRVKNNLQIVSSLLMLERHGAPEEPAVRGGMDRTLSRIRTIARVHDQLYHGKNLAQVDLAGYLEGLAGEIAAAYDPDRTLELNIRLEPVVTDLDRSLPIGLLVHELLVNCYRHAFEVRDERDVREQHAVLLRLTNGNGRLELEVSDETGEGQQDDRANVQPLAQTLIHALVHQIDGEIVAENGRGTSIELRAPLASPRA